MVYSIFYVWEDLADFARYKPGKARRLLFVSKDAICPA